MLSHFNKFLSRIQFSHPVFANKNISILIFKYLSGEDLFQLIQVNFATRILIKSTPQFEITMLNYTLKKSNECIERLRIKSVPIYTFEKFTKRDIPRIPINPIKISRKSHSNCVIKEQGQEKKIKLDKKWTEFVKYFYEYAKDEGFEIRKRKDFNEEQAWQDYKAKFDRFYYDYIKHIQQEREKNSEFTLSKTFGKAKEVFREINLKFHVCTDFWYYSLFRCLTHKRPITPLDIL